MTKQTAQNRSAPARGGHALELGTEWTRVVAKSGRTMTLADPEMAKSVKQFEKTVTASKDSALDFLRRAGIATATGRLKKVYGG
jgi:hypothetical protein